MIKLSVNLPSETVASLRAMADLQGTTMTQVLRCAIQTERLLRNAVRSGKKIIVEESDGKRHQLVFVSHQGL